MGFQRKTRGTCCCGWQCCGYFCLWCEQDVAFNQSVFALLEHNDVCFGGFPGFVRGGFDFQFLYFFVANWSETYMLLALYWIFVVSAVGTLMPHNSVCCLLSSQANFMMWNRRFHWMWKAVVACFCSSVVTKHLRDEGAQWSIWSIECSTWQSHC